MIKLKHNDFPEAANINDAVYNKTYLLQLMPWHRMRSMRLTKSMMTRVSDPSMGGHMM